MISVDHLTTAKAPVKARPVFLDSKPGLTVIVRYDYLTGEAQDKDWWIGQIIWCEGGARDPRVNTLFQVADVDTGVIRWVNADLITHIVPAC